MNELILGPQLPIGNTSFDTTQVAMARKLGEQCPAVAPQPPASPVKPLRKDFASDEAFRTAVNTWLVDPAIQAWQGALNSYNVNLMYYDLPLSLYIVYKRTGDPYFLALARKAADSWWTHPEYIGEGKIQKFPDEATPPPRHVGIMGLMLRALDGRPEMWPFIVSYVRSFANIYLLWRLQNTTLHVDVREGAFVFHFLVLLSQCLPDTYPNAAQIRAEVMADCERILIEYYARLEYPCGCWRYDGGPDADGSPTIKFTQPFALGLLLHAFIDLHQVTANTTIKQTLETMILKVSRHLYLDGPYRKNDPIPYDPRKRWRSFWYLWHGGTLANPTKFEQGGWSYPGNNIGEVQDARQAIGPIVAVYGYAYKISGDPLYQEALTELWDSAYGETDGIKTYFNTDGKGFNQHCRRAGSGPVWAGWTQTFPPSLPTVPDPIPTPTEPPKPTEPPTTPTTPPTDSIPVVVITAPASGAVVTGQVNVTVSVTNPAGITESYLIVDGVVAAGANSLVDMFSLDAGKLGEGSHSMYVRVWKGSVSFDSKVSSVTVKNVVGPPIVEPPIPPVVEPPIPPIPPIPPAPTCTITVPEQLALPPNSSSTLTVAVVADPSLLPFQVSATAADGQITVTPSSQRVDKPSMLLAFNVRTKKRSSSVRFNSPCGQKVTRIIVR